MNSDLIEEVDWNGNTIAVHPVTRLKEKMFPHKVSLIIPRGDKNKFIFAKRAKDKFPYPGTWTCGIGGKVNAGETPENAAKREAAEETGLKTDLELLSIFKYNSEEYKAVFHLFTTKSPVSISHLTIDKNEIDYLQEMTLEEIENIVKNSPKDCAPTFIYAVNALKSSIIDNKAK